MPLTFNFYNPASIPFTCCVGIFPVSKVFVCMGQRSRKGAHILQSSLFQFSLSDPLLNTMVRNWLSGSHLLCISVCRLINNQFTVAGMKRLATALTHNTALKEIWWGSCIISQWLFRHLSIFSPNASTNCFHTVGVLLHSGFIIVRVEFSDKSKHNYN